MPLSERDTLRVDVPVGFLLAEPREIAVVLDRPADTPLSIRLRLIPAHADDATGDPPGPPARPARGRHHAHHADLFEPEYGGSD
jgi:hypothetical protein